MLVPIFVFAVAAGVLAFLLSNMPDKEFTVSEMFDSVFPGLDMTTVHAAAPPTLLKDEQLHEYHFGRYKKAIPSPLLHPLSLGQTVFERKHWIFFSVTADEHLIGVVLANMGYVSSGFAYVFNSKTLEYDSVSAMLPLSMGASLSQTSLSGCSKWESPFSSALTLKFCHNADESWNLHVHARLDGGSRLHLNSNISATDDQFAMSYPFGPQRPAYTHKCAGMNSTSVIKITSKEKSPLPSKIINKPTLGLLDWTKGMHRRFTLWWWAAISFFSQGSRIGLQLSHGVYLDANGNDLENAVWVDGVMTVLNEKIRWQGEPGNGDLEADKEFSIESDTLSLKFKGRAPMENEIRAHPIAYGNLRHWFGVYSGSITVNKVTYTLDGVVGILEDHRATW